MDCVYERTSDGRINLSFTATVTELLLICTSIFSVVTASVSKCLSFFNH